LALRVEQLREMVPWEGVSNSRLDSKDCKRASATRVVTIRILSSMPSFARGFSKNASVVTNNALQQALLRELGCCLLP
jgi:hypothetical protein